MCTWSAQERVIAPCRSRDIRRFNNPHIYGLSYRLDSTTITYNKTNEPMRRSISIDIECYPRFWFKLYYNFMFCFALLLFLLLHHFSVFTPLCIQRTPRVNYCINKYPPRSTSSFSPDVIKNNVFACC